MTRSRPRAWSTTPKSRSACDPSRVARTRRAARSRSEAPGALQTAGKVNQLIEGAKDAEGAVQEALIEQAYSTIRGWCETVVETELLAGVPSATKPT